MHLFTSWLCGPDAAVRGRLSMHRIRGVSSSARCSCITRTGLQAVRLQTARPSRARPSSSRRAFRRDCTFASQLGCEFTPKGEAVAQDPLSRPDRPSRVFVVGDASFGGQFAVVAAAEGAKAAVLINKQFQTEAGHALARRARRTHGGGVDAPRSAKGGRGHHDHRIGADRYPHLSLTVIAIVAAIFALQDRQQFFIPLVIAVLVSYALDPVVSGIAAGVCHARSRPRSHCCWSSAASAEGRTACAARSSRSCSNCRRPHSACARRSQGPPGEPWRHHRAGAEGCLGAVAGRERRPPRRPRRPKAWSASRSRSPP